MQLAIVGGTILVLMLAGMLVLNVARDALAIVLSHHEPHAVPIRRGMAKAQAAPGADPAADSSAAPAAPAAPAANAAPPPDGPFVVRSILSIPGPIRFGEFYWDDSKAEPGPLVVTVDLTARTLSVFRNGHEIGATAILKGYGEKPTPVGIFPITQKDEHHVSSTYDAPMPYMMRLTSDGVSIHGAKVANGYATNGCVGVPEDFAHKLFDVAHIGDRVIITDGKRMQVGDPIIADTRGNAPHS